MSDSDKELKVTDKRMFTPDGELRDEYRHLQDREAEGSAADSPTATGEGPGARDAVSEQAKAEATAAAPDHEANRGAAKAEPGPSGRVEIPPTGHGLDQPTFYDLVGMLAQPIAVCLGDAKLPGGESAENLDLARFYIDLLEVLRAKTSGNLTAQEVDFLDDLLYQLRLRYVQKRG